jgi:hypothetical protein
LSSSEPYTIQYKYKSSNDLRIEKNQILISNALNKNQIKTFK